MPGENTLNYREIGGSLWVIGGQLQFATGGFLFNSLNPGVTAHAGGGQANATPLNGMYNDVTVVANQGDSVALPPATAGAEITVANHGANPMQVFGAGTDTINSIATATGISHGVGQIATYACAVAGNWEVQFSLAQQPGIVAITAAGAISPHVPHEYVITNGAVTALTLAAPTAGTDDGVKITVSSNTAFAHTITTTGLLETGTVSVNTATFAAQKGASVSFMAYQGKWIVQCSNAITFS